MKKLVLLTKHLGTDFEYMSPFINSLKDEFVITIVSNQKIDELGLKFFNEYDLVITTGNDHRFFLKFDEEEFQFKILSMNHSLSGPNKANFYQIRKRLEFSSKNQEKIFTLDPEFYTKLYKNVPTGNHCFHRYYYKIYNMLSGERFMNRNLKVYFNHWSTPLKEVSRIIDKHYHPFTNFKIKLHPACLPDEIENGDSIFLKTHEISKIDYYKWYESIKPYLIDYSLAKAIDSSDRLIFDGGSNTPIEAMIRIATSDSLYKEIVLEDTDYNKEWVDDDYIKMIRSQLTENLIKINPTTYVYESARKGKIVNYYKLDDNLNNYLSSFKELIGEICHI